MSPVTVWEAGDPGKPLLMAKTGSAPQRTASSAGGGADAGDAVLAGRYRLDHILGRGGMAVVHKATDLVLDRAVAIKVFSSDGDAADASRYEHEARILASLNHSGLVTVYDAGVDATEDLVKPFLVMEYVPGATLADVLRDGPLNTVEVARLGAELSTALAYVHRHGVVHRDMKPANILLPAPEEGVPSDRLGAKLTDFGISRLVSGGRITTTSRRLGTVAYLSPEQVRAEEVGPPSDVYSLGLVLAECLTGQLVFGGDGVEAAAARLHEPPGLPSTLAPEWGRLLRDMLDLDPQRRPTAAEVSVALTGLMVSPVADVTQAAPVGTPSDPVATQAGATLPGQPAANETVAIPQLASPPPDDAVDAGPYATKVLHVPPELLEPRRRRPGWSIAWTRPWKIATGVVAALFVFLVIALAAPPLHTPEHVRSPAYPTVPGQLGTDLAKLQQQVRQ